MTMHDRLTRLFCCPAGCASPDACRSGETQHIEIHQAAALAVRELPGLLCEQWKARGPLSRATVYGGDE